MDWSKYPFGEPPELDESMHPYNLLGKEAWYKLPIEERVTLWKEWARPELEWHEKKDRYFLDLESEEG